MSRFWKFVAYGSLAAVLAFGPIVSVRADDKKEAAAKEEEETDPYKVPEDATVDELIEFIRKVQAIRAGITTQAQFNEWRAKAPVAMKAGAEQIQMIEKDKKSKNWRMANAILLTLESQTMGEASAEAKADLLKKAQEHISGASEKGVEELQVAMGIARGFEFGGSKDLAAKAYADFGPLFSDSKDERVARQGKMMVGAARRMNLMGNEMELKGTTLDGKKFDVANLKGKVVLVDFWATWCGPCRAEYPNLLKNYEAYHDKGFEVVGVSIDHDRDALEKYVEKEEVRWPTLHEKDGEGSHPAAEFYGVMGIPTVILINKEGKVISLNARGPELGRLLEKELGEPSETKTDAKAESK